MRLSTGRPNHIKGAANAEVQTTLRVQQMQMF